MKCFQKNACLLVCLICLFCILTPMNQAWGGRYNNLKDIKEWSHVSLEFIMGESETILNHKKLQDFARLKFKNNFSNMKFGDHPTVERTKVGFILISVFTVEGDLMAAYNIEIEAFTVRGGDLYPSGDERLGYCSIDDLEEKVKNSITTQIEELAIKYYKAKGEI